MTQAIPSYQIFFYLLQNQFLIKWSERLIFFGGVQMPHYAETSYGSLGKIWVCPSVKEKWAFPISMILTLTLLDKNCWNFINNPGSPSLLRCQSTFFLLRIICLRYFDMEDLVSFTLCFRVPNMREDKRRQKIFKKFSSVVVLPSFF